MTNRRNGTGTIKKPLNAALYPAQLKAICSDHRFAIIEASSKSGKTIGCLTWLLQEAWLQNPEQRQDRIFWWVAPVYNQAQIAYRRAKNGLQQSFRKANDSALTIELLNGSLLQFKSADNPDNLFGEDVWGCVIDEATRMKETSWHAVRSTLASTNGRCRIIGNVKGRSNWAYKLSRMAENGADPDWLYSRLTAYDAIIGGVLTEEEVLSAKKTLPENVFQELFEAMPSDDESNPFGVQHIEKCIVEVMSPKDPVCYGIDLARSQDYTVLIGLDEDNNVCRFERFQQNWAVAVDLIKNEIGQIPTLVDSTGVGDPIAQELERTNNAKGFKFSSTSKQQIMENLAVLIQRGDIGFPEGNITKELYDYGYEVTRTGTRYQALSGFDDCVCALALAAWQSRDLPGIGVW